MNDTRRCYSAELDELVEKDAPEDEILGRMQELINRISGLLAVVAHEIHPRDYPFVVACMELSCANQRSLFTEEQLQLIEDLKTVLQRRDRLPEED